MYFNQPNLHREVYNLMKPETIYEIELMFKQLWIKIKMKQ